MKTALYLRRSSFSVPLAVVDKCGMTEPEGDAISRPARFRFLGSQLQGRIQRGGASLQTMSTLQPPSSRRAFRHECTSRCTKKYGRIVCLQIIPPPQKTKFWIRPCSAVLFARRKNQECLAARNQQKVTCWSGHCSGKFHQSALGQKVAAEVGMKLVSLGYTRCSAAFAKQLGMQFACDPAQTQRPG